MPLNNQGTIAVVATVVGESVYDFSPQDTLAGLAQIPSGGITLGLPPNPGDGEWYEFADTDGSCSPGSPIIVQGGAHTIVGGASITYVAPFASAILIFVARLRTWVTLGSTGTPSISSALIVPDIAALEAVSGIPLQSGASALVQTVSGGTLVGPGTAPSARYETGTGAGQPVVVTGDAPVAIGQWIQQVATGDIGHQTASLCLDVFLTAPTNQAIVFTLASAAQALTGLKLNASVQEQVAGI